MTGTTPSDIHVEELGHVTVLTIDRPERMNALRHQTYDELEQAVRHTTARCIVVTGSGRAFCAGDDIHELMVPNGDKATRVRERSGLTPLASALAHTSIPVVAAVNGPAVGWGMELALLADVRIAGRSARFGELFVKRGLVADAPGLIRLTQAIGREWAARLLFTGDLIDAAQALSIGLVSEVVHDDVLRDRALEVAGSIAANPPLAVGAIKEGLRRAVDPDWDALGAWITRQYEHLFTTEDHREGVAAFVERREGHFVGR